MNRRMRRMKRACKRLHVILNGEEMSMLSSQSCPCVECGKTCWPKDEYLVRSATWAEAGMKGYRSGRLHMACLEKRLGRKLKPKEILIWFVRYVGRRVQIEMRREFLSSPEYLDHGGA